MCLNQVTEMKQTLNDNVYTVTLKINDLLLFGNLNRLLDLVPVITAHFLQIRSQTTGSTTASQWEGGGYVEEFIIRIDLKDRFAFQENSQCRHSH